MLQVAIDLTGDPAKTIVALGIVDISTAQTAEGDNLEFRGSSFRGANAATEWVVAAEHAAVTGDEPPNGVRVLTLFTPPDPPSDNIAQLRGTLHIRSAREQVDAVVTNLNDRLDRRIKDRNLSKFGLEFAIMIEENQLMFRLLEGSEDRIAGIFPIDQDGARIEGVVQTTTVENSNRIHRFTFSRRVPPRVGLKFSLNRGVQDIEIPFRFSNLPIPPQTNGMTSPPSGTPVAPGFPPPQQTPPIATPRGTSATDS
ncbi:MAG: hypothetical protein KF861_02460, partial [Planctomycetaceae bacterium]|nr:hypothetical protein [Planctomycetaceae bacterium]